MTQPVFRFAPSPNGEMHLGHAYSALLNLKLAREANGKCLLRIENIDTVRCTLQLEKQMLEDLEWIGFEWDEQPRRQSEHFDDYRDVLERLRAKGLLYPSTMSRSDIKQCVSAYEKDGEQWPRDPDGSPLYPGKERQLTQDESEAIMASGTPYSLRLNMEKALKVTGDRQRWDEYSDGTLIKIIANPQAWGDVVLARKDTPASYHLCCVIDDHAQGVTDIVRGQDLYHATSVHVILQKLLDCSRPRYRHHSLITDDLGKKLSKSEKAVGIKTLREQGISAGAIRNLLFHEQ